MIEPTEADIGRNVIYTARHPKAVPEQGTITSFNPTAVFVRYRGDTNSKATARADLQYADAR
jgi:hypothetical protein